MVDFIGSFLCEEESLYTHRHTQLTAHTHARVCAHTHTHTILDHSRDRNHDRGNGSSILDLIESSLPFLQLEKN